jgi:hypothetical protein
MRTAAALAVVTLALASPALAESVFVKYRGPVPLDTFECQDVTDSRFIQRVCFDQAQAYMLISLKGTYYQYCEIGSAVVQALLASPSKGKLYNASIKGTGSDGPFDCRTHRLPDY